MSMRLFFVLLTVVGSGYLLFTERGERRFTIAALAISSIGLLLQLNVITLHLRYARTVVWAAIAVCAAILWLRQNSKSASTVSAGLLFVSALTVALSLKLLH
jgi:hypothetical protein